MTFYLKMSSVKALEIQLTWWMQYCIIEATGELRKSVLSGLYLFKNKNFANTVYTAEYIQC